MATSDRLRTYAAKDMDDIKDMYKGWASDYEKDVLDGMGYVAPREAAKAFSKILDNTNARVLDAGCGTGLVGKELRNLGYKSMDGMDISPDMLKAAAGKNVYGQLMEGDLTAGLDIANDTYDGTICVGTFTHGHVGPDGLGELIRITRTGGPITFTVNDGVYDEEKYDEALETLEKEGRVKVESKKRADYLPDEDVGCRLITLRVA